MEQSERGEKDSRAGAHAEKENIKGLWSGDKRLYMLIC